MVLPRVRCFDVYALHNMRKVYARLVEIAKNSDTVMLKELLPLYGYDSGPHRLARSMEKNKLCEVVVKYPDSYMRFTDKNNLSIALQEIEQEIKRRKGTKPAKGGDWKTKQPIDTVAQEEAMKKAAAGLDAMSKILFNKIPQRSVHG